MTLEEKSLEITQDGPPLLNIQQAADMLGVSKGTVRRWCRLGILECVRVNRRGDRRFQRECLQRILTPKKTGRPKKGEKERGKLG